MELRPPTPTSSKKGIMEMVDEVVEGKKRKLGYGWILFDPEGVRGKGVVVGLRLGGVSGVVGIGDVLAALEEVGFILAEGARWLVGEKERKRREVLGHTSSTIVAFVRGVVEVDVLLKKGLWLGGRWPLVKMYEAVQPIRAKKSLVWVGEMLDKVMKNESSALSLVNMSFKGIHGAVQGLVEKVREMKLGKKEVRVWPGQEVWGWRDVEVKVEKGLEKERVDFTSKVKKDNCGESWFPTSAKNPSWSQEEPPIASDSSGGKSRGVYATMEEVLKAVGLCEEEIKKFVEGMED